VFDNEVHLEYERKLSDWMALEAIIRQKDKEVTAANIAKLSQTAGNLNDLISYFYCANYINLKYQDPKKMSSST